MLDMSSILNLIPSKAIRDYLISIDYKFDAKNAFGVICNFLSSEDEYNKKKLKEYLQLIIDNCEDGSVFEEHQWNEEEWKACDKYKCHNFIRDIMRRIDSANDEDFIFWRAFPSNFPQETFGCSVPLPFRNGDILYIPSIKYNIEGLADRPFLIRQFEKESKSNVITARVFNNEFTYCVVNDGMIIEDTLFRYGLDYWVDIIYHCEFYCGDYDAKNLILKEMSDSCKSNKFDEFLNKNRSRISTYEDTEKERLESLISDGVVSDDAEEKLCDDVDISF